MIFVPFWLAIIFLIILFFFGLITTQTCEDVRLISSWWLGFYLTMMVIIFATLLGITTKLPEGVEEYEEEYSYNYTEEDCFCWFDCTRVGTRTRIQRRLVYSAKEIAIPASDINVSLLFFSVCFSNFLLFLFNNFWKLHRFFKSLLICSFSFYVSTGLFSSIFISKLFILIFPTVLGLLLSIPIYLVFFFKRSKN